MSAPRHPRVVAVVLVVVEQRVDVVLVLLLAPRKCPLAAKPAAVKGEKAAAALHRATARMVASEPEKAEQSRPHGMRRA